MSRIYLHFLTYSQGWNSLRQVNFFTLIFEKNLKIRTQNFKEHLYNVFRKSWNQY